jgi:hypothetical protein
MGVRLPMPGDDVAMNGCEPGGFARLAPET